MRCPLPRPLLSAATTFALIALFALVARAHHYRLESASTPAMFLRDGRSDSEIEPAGIAIIGDARRALVADDRAGTLHVVDLATGEIIGAPLSSPKFPTATKVGPNWEGMALDSLGNYYLVGSHSGTSDLERAATSVLIRFRLQAGATPAIDDESVVRWEIDGALESVLKKQGVDASLIAQREIAGLAIREVGGHRELVIGLRKPDDKIRAFSADITTAPAPGGALELRSLFAFDAEPADDSTPQLAALEYVPSMGGFLVLTAAESTKNANHGNTLWLVNNGAPRQARSYATLEPTMKAGGLTVLGVEARGHRTTIKLLITYDNDPHATKIPSRFQTALLVHDRT